MILSDVVDEGRRLSGLLEQAGIRARLLGGVGIALHAHGPIPASLRRSYGDLDFAVRRADGPAFTRSLVAAGYEPNERFNAVHGAKRLLFYDPQNARQIDAFVGVFRMCHTLDLGSRLSAPGPSLAPVDLLLTKLQIVALNEKDVVDTVLLLSDHPVSSGPEAIDPLELVRIVGHDWGWYTTVSDNLARVADHVEHTGTIDHMIQRTVGERVADLRRTLELAPKTIGWRARATLGRRVPWHETPEEVG
jgi:hypothetical protein